MANEIQFSTRTGIVTYTEVRNPAAQIYNVASGALMPYFSGLGNTSIAALEQGATGYYTASFPAVAAGAYNVRARQQIGGSAADSDPVVAVGDLQWDGANVLPLANLATSGQVSQIGPIRLARGTMIRNFSLYLKSSADHVTPFTSGVVSGQIARDGGAFGPLQSGALLEQGLGFYSLQALTSGDLLANTVSLLFTANGVSGGSSDPLPMSVVLQRTSGQ